MSPQRGLGCCARDRRSQRALLPSHTLPPDPAVLGRRRHAAGRAPAVFGSPAAARLPPARTRDEAGGANPLLLCPPQICPLCINDLDETERAWLPCSCGCAWGWLTCNAAAPPRPTIVHRLNCGLHAELVYSCPCKAGCSCPLPASLPADRTCCGRALPCCCSYQLCLFCYDRLKTEFSNRCPNCREEYDSDFQAGLRRRQERVAQLQREAAAAREAAKAAAAAAPAERGAGSRAAAPPPPPPPRAAGAARSPRSL